MLYPALWNSAGAAAIHRASIKIDIRACRLLLLADTVVKTTACRAVARSHSCALPQPP